MLQSIETQISQSRCLGVSVNSEHTTFFAKLVQLDYPGIADILCGGILAPTLSGLLFVQLICASFKLLFYWFRLLLIAAAFNLGI